MTVVWVALGFLAGLLLGATSVNIGFGNEINQTFTDDVQVLGTVKGKHTTLMSGGTYYTSNIMYTPTEFKIDHFNRGKTIAVDITGREISIDRLYDNPEEVPQR